MKLAKKVLAVVLAMLMLTVTFAMMSSANTSDYVLKFNEDGKFKIMMFADSQDNEELEETTTQLMKEALAAHNPDLVIFMGDNTVAKGELQAEAIAKVVAPVVEAGIPFTVVFGNHDHQQGYDNDELFAMYQKAGGEYFLAYDAVPELHGTATHNLPVYSNDGSQIKFNLWMIDSGAYVDDGYDCVRKDQIDWYLETSNALAAQAGGLVPSMAFQHIIVGEIMDVFYKEKSEVPFSVESKFCNGKEYDLTFADFSAIKDGMLTEPPCPGVENFGQFDALLCNLCI